MIEHAPVPDLQCGWHRCVQKSGFPAGRQKKGKRQKKQKMPGQSAETGMNSSHAFLSMNKG
jgi:hypothetical protein